MPLFMSISGYLYGKHHNSSFSYLSFVKKKAKRLLLPYISIMGIYYIIKYLSEVTIGVNTPIGITSLLYTLFINPYGGFVSFLWYVYVLFLIYLIVPFFKKLPLLVVISFVIYFIPFPSLFCLNMLSKHMLFFVLGLLLYKYLSQGKNLDVRYLFVPSLALQILLYIYIEQLPNIAFDFILALLGIVTVYSLSKLITDYKLPLLRYIGEYSSEIYFLHIIFILGVVTFSKMLPITFNWMGYVQLILQLIAGLTGPLFFAILLKKLKMKKLYQILFGKSI